MNQVADGQPAPGRPRSWRNRFRQRLSTIRDAALSAVIERMGRAAARRTWSECQRSGARLGDVAWRFAARDRRRTLAHLQLAFPDLDESQRTTLGRDSFRHLGICLMELLHVTSRPREVALDVVSIDGWNNLEAARAAGRPIVLVTGHCGNWELIGAVLGSHGVPIAAVARSLEGDGLNRALLRARAHFGVETIARGSATSARQLLGFLRRGTSLAMLIDQDTRVDGVWAPFFGRPAFTPSGAWTLARRFDAIVMPMFIARLPDGGHTLFLEPALPMSDDVTESVTRMNLRIEQHIRRFPAQWVWMHRRWRRRPPEEVEGSRAVP